MAVVMCMTTAACVYFQPLSADGDTEKASSTCEKHAIEMQKRVVPIVYGLPRESEFEEMRVKPEAFPNGCTYIIGGCVVGDENKATVYICPRCEETRTEWIKAKGYEGLNKP